jgi:type IV pilus assembly protein PilX
MTGIIMTRRRYSTRRKQNGVILFISLILLLILTLIGIAAARLQVSQEVMARNDHNHQLAIQAAEAALRSAEASIWNGIYSSTDFAANSNGLYELATEVSTGAGTSYADSIDWNIPGTTSKPYAGPALSAVPAPPSQSQIIMESLPPEARAGEPLCTASYGASQSCSVYRITAHAVGGDATANATLQSIFH